MTLGEIHWDAYRGATRGAGWSVPHGPFASLSEAHQSAVEAGAQAVADQVLKTGAYADPQETAPVIVYLSIGNSDDKLSQANWSDFVGDIRSRVVVRAHTVHGMWFSAPDSRWQNACWCLEFRDARDYADARASAAGVRQRYGQDSVAWAVARTEFL